MLSPGTTLGGRYRLDERIAGGGMGDVWRGTDEVLGRTVAVKILLPALLEEAGFAERFRGEARTMATINHPGVVDVYDYGSENGTAFLVMEYVEGDALSRTLSRVGRLTPARTMALVAQAADALHAAHEKGIVHRDVKPGNLLVRPNGTLVLTDFGIARSAMVGQLTAAGSVLGTASYISPEQASGAGATPLSDVYALGVVAYQCLSGRRPFEGDNPLEIAMRHVREAPPPLPSDIPPAVRQIVERAMAKDPSARWPSAAALAQVSRRTSAQLASAGATGTTRAPQQAPTSGAPAPVASGPLGPSSGPPASPASPAGPPAPVAPGATRVMPAGFGATGVVGAGGPPGSPVGSVSGGPISGAPGSGGAPQTSPVPGSFAGAGPRDAAGQGQFARGAAAVPAPPRPAGDTGYTFVGGPTGYQPAPASAPPGRRNGMLILAGVLAVLVVLLCVGGGLYFLRNASKNTPSGGSTNANSPGPTAPPPSTAAPLGTGKVLNIPCDSLKGQQFFVVENSLRTNGYKVKRVNQPGGRSGQVVDIDHCGGTPQGTEVTVTVSTGQSSQGPGGGGEPVVPCLPPLIACTPSPTQ
jgi:serine/threonine-protein kinase